jgi:hypothetical protein
MFIDLNRTNTIGHCLNLVKPRRRLHIMKFSFAHRIVYIDFRLSVRGCLGNTNLSEVGLHLFPFSINNFI